MKEIYPHSSDVQDSIIVHIPHASTFFPQDVPEGLYAQDLLESTDWFTDRIFQSPLTTVHAEASRVFVDVERFVVDDMDAYGRGYNYTHDVEGQPYEFEKNADLVLECYIKHHEKLTALVKEKLENAGVCIILDCHAFNFEPLYFEAKGERPDICIGTDSFHTPKWFEDYVVSFYTGLGYSVQVNAPYSGSIVPLEYYKKNKKVYSIMIEVNKKLYMCVDSVDSAVEKLNGEFIQLIEGIY